MVSKWFEKTVEYAFVCRSCSLFAMPLDGDYEKAGDTIFGEGDQFFLIEFKKENDDSCINSEKYKYKDWQSSINTLKNAKGHECHYVIFGEFRGTWDIYYKSYFDYIEKTKDKEEVVNKGLADFEKLPLDEFKEYIKLVMEEKLKGKSVSDASSIVEELSNNIIVVSDKGAVSSILEAIGALKVELGPEAQKTIDSQKQENKERNTLTPKGP